MRIQLKVPRAVGSGLASVSVRPAAPAAIPRPPRPPDGPGCSRWLSCTCCRPQAQNAAPEKVDTAFFTRQSLPLPRQAYATQAVAAASPDEDHDRGRGKGRSALLPLPPTLPYSPDSVPFQRHLQHLSLAVVSSTQKESWRTYLALHPSLRRYIPDDLFRSLLAHQLSNEHARQSWVRGLALIKFAKQCGVSAGQLGEENLRTALRSGFDLVLRTKVSDLKLYWGDLMALWRELVISLEQGGKGKGRVKGKEQEDRMPLDLRRGYLQLHVKRPSTASGSRAEKLTAAAAALREVVEQYGTRGIQREAGKIVSLYQGSDESIHLDALSLAAWCADCGLAIPETDTFLVMLRLYGLYENQGPDPLKLLDSAIQKHVIAKLDPAGPGSGADHIKAVLIQIRHRFRPHAQRTVDSVEANETVPQLTRRVVRLLDTSAPDLNIAVTALASILKREGEVEAVVAKLLGHLEQQPNPGVLQRLTHLLLDHEAVQHLRLDHTQSLLHSLVACLPDADAYTLCRKIYAIARQHGYRWQPAHRALWHRLFHHAVDSHRRHLHFASRLYADQQADGMHASRSDLISFVRTVGMSRSASRNLLLERLVNDLPDRRDTATPPESLIIALVQGLTSSQDASDAALALGLTRKILQGRPIPGPAAELLIQTFAKSASLSHLRHAVHLLDEAPTSTAHSFNHVIFSMIAHSRSEPQSGQISRREALSQAVGLYTRMLERGIEATPRTISLFLRALVDARYVDSALGIFDASVRHHFSLKPNAVGRLMVRLILDDRLDEAAKVESRWRGMSIAASETGKRYDRAIVGARVLLDTKRGLEVDLSDIAKRTGWTSNVPFSRFIEILKPRSVTDSATSQTEPAYEGAGEHHEHSGSARPAAMATDRIRRPWIRSDNNNHNGRSSTSARKEDFGADLMVATRNGSIVT